MNGATCNSAPDPETPNERTVLIVIFGLCLGVAIGVGAWLALSMRSDRIHESAQATIQADDRRALVACRADLARYAEIDALAQAYDKRAAGR